MQRPDCPEGRAPVWRRSVPNQVGFPGRTATLPHQDLEAAARQGALHDVVLAHRRAAGDAQQIRVFDSLGSSPRDRFILVGAHPDAPGFHPTIDHRADPKSPSHKSDKDPPSPRARDLAAGGEQGDARPRGSPAPRRCPLPRAVRRGGIEPGAGGNEPFAGAKIDRDCADVGRAARGRSVDRSAPRPRGAFFPAAPPDPRPPEPERR